MSCDLLNFMLPHARQGCTWDGLTWTVGNVPDGHTEFAAALATAEFYIQDADNQNLLYLTSANAGDITLNATAAGAWSVTVEPRIMTAAAGDHTYMLILTDTDGVRGQWMGGAIRIKPEPI